MNPNGPADIKGQGNILVVVDAGSGWIEAFATNDKIL